MVRGVNRTVIEVSCTEHDLFERAILFVRPGARKSEPALRREADEYVALTGMSLDEPERKGRWKTVLVCGGLPAAAAGLGLLAGALLL